MTTKTKILIGVLIIGLVSGCVLFALYIRGAISPWRPGPPILGTVSIFTDKTEYEQGETVKITIRNNLDKSIWYLSDRSSWWDLEKQVNKDWKQIDLFPPISTEGREECVQPLPPQSIEEILKELKPNFEIEDTWNLRNCELEIGVSISIDFIDSGNYRLSFTYGFSKDSYGEKIIYSNEFTIKEKAEDVVPKDKTSCEALSGKWGRIGLDPEEYCNLPTSDAGKECSSSNKCEGSCIAKLSEEDWDKAIHGVVYTKGKCTAWKVTVGCRAFVEDGKVRILCVD
jgi:hypothetical protein